MRTENNYIFFTGGDSGDIYVFQYIEVKKQVKLSVIYKKVHLGMIQDITCDCNYVASVCHLGYILVWDTTSSINNRIEFQVR